MHTCKIIDSCGWFQEDIQHWENIGIHTDNLEVDFKQVQEWKNGVIERLTGGVKQLLKSHGVEVKKGKAFFQSSNTVRIDMEHNAETVNFENAIIATGSQPIELPGFEFSKDKVISSRELLDLEEVPDEIVVIGGGYIGMEAVTKFCKFGSTVKVVEFQDRVLSNFDEELVSKIQEVSGCYNDEIYTSTEAKELKYRDEKAVVVADKNGEKIEIEGDYVLAAVGRTVSPSINGLNIENTEIELDENGFVKTDQQMKTTDENIYAIGDIAGQPMLAHKAYREGKVAAEAVAGEPAAFDNQYIPKVTYTDPEIAVVGLNPDEARNQYDEIKIGKFPFSSSGRALTTNHEDGFVRVVASGEDKILGVQILGPRASDMIAEATLALEMQAYLDDVVNTIHAHPTFPEAFAEACEDALGKSIHTG